MPTIRSLNLFSKWRRFYSQILILEGTSTGSNHGLLINNPQVKKLINVAEVDLYYYQVKWQIPFHSVYTVSEFAYSNYFTYELKAFVSRIGTSETVVRDFGRRFLCLVS